MKNLHILPTNKPSRLHYSKDKTDEKISYKLILKQGSLTCNDGLLSGQKNIYITSDEEIKEGDWFYDTYCNVVSKLTVHGKDNRISEFKKIILTTDQDLIKDGVQSIDDDFLEWFVKNSSCKEVVVNLIQTEPLKGFIYNFEYKITIPKEKFKHIPYTGKVWEPVKQQTPIEEIMELCKQKISIGQETIDTQELHDWIETKLLKKELALLKKTWESGFRNGLY